MSFTSRGKWLVGLDGKFHTIELENDWTGTVRVTVDNNVVFQKWQFLINVHFRIDSHSLIVKEKPFPKVGYVLLSDGTEHESSDAIILTSQSNSVSSATKLSDSEIQVVSESNMQETTHIVDTEEFPLDNSAGTDVLKIDHEISKTVSNELTINTGAQFSGTLDIGLLNAIKAEISANLQKNLGQKINETITRRQTLHFTVPAKSSVTYTVIWKRKSRSAECIVFAQNKLHQLNYKANYDLTYEVKSK